MKPTGMPPDPRPGARPAWTRMAKWLLLALAIGLFVRTLGQTDLASAFALLRGLGPMAPLLAIPALLVLAIETVAWQLSLRVLGPAPARTTWTLARIRLATDAALMSLPGGFVLAEYLIPVLLRDRSGMSLSRAAAASVARKWLGTRAHALYIFLGAALGGSFLRASSARFVGAHTGEFQALPWIVVGLGCLPLSFAVFAEVLARRGDLRRLAPASLRDLAKDIDVELNRIMRQPARTTIVSTLLYLAGFVCEALEAFVIARALGSPLGFVEVLAIESGLSMVRSVVVFAPSGIGVQDVGYVAIFGPTLGPAFVMVKRARELVWIAAGWLILSVMTSSKRASPSTQTPTPTSTPASWPPSGPSPCRQVERAA